MTIKQVVMISSATGPQSGKSTLADFLIKNAERRWNSWNSAPYPRPCSFAETLKLMVRPLLERLLNTFAKEEIDAYLSGDKKEEPLPLIGVSSRFLMQKLGTEWRNLVDEQLWTKLMLQQLDQMGCYEWAYMDFTMVVIDDLRFRHELTAVKTWCEVNGAKLWHIRVHRPANNYTATHASELAVFDEYEVDLHLYNDGTKEEFLAKLPERLQGIGLELK